MGEVWQHAIKSIIWDVTRGVKIQLLPHGRMLASTLGWNAVCLWEAATGAERRRWKTPELHTSAIAFSPDGRTVASTGADTTVLLWDVRNPLRPIAKAKATPTELWKTLASPDAEQAYDAILTLARTPDTTVRHMRDLLRPVRSKTATSEKLVADLDSDEFVTREKASKGLIEMGASVEFTLRKVLEKKPSLEVSRRIEAILRKYQTHPLTPSELQQIRAIEALEYCGTTEAKRHLETLATGATEARLTQEAKAALARWKK